MTDTPTSGASRSERWSLNDERDFLARSLEDADREHAAGDLSDEDYAVLVARDRQKLAEVDAALAALGPEPVQAAPFVLAQESAGTSSGPRREWRRIGIFACCFLIVAGAVILVTHALQSSTPGQPVTGSISIPKQQLIEEELQEGQAFMAQNQNVDALRDFAAVLQDDPKDPEALSDSGWLTWRYGVSLHSTVYEQTGLGDLQRAVRVAPTFYKGHLYLGLVLYYQDKDYTGAAAQFTQFLAEDPPTVDISLATSEMVDAYQKAGLPVPANAVPPSTTTTTTPVHSTTSAP